VGLIPRKFFPCNSGYRIKWIQGTLPLDIKRPECDDLQDRLQMVLNIKKDWRYTSIRNSSLIVFHSANKYFAVDKEIRGDWGSTSGHLCELVTSLGV
jgi:hypothetical protein